LRWKRFLPCVEALEGRWAPTCNAQFTVCTVTNLTDANPAPPDSLRFALETVKKGGTVDFAPGLTGTIVLSGGTLTIDRDLKLVGPGADKLSVNGNNNFQDLMLLSATGSQMTVTVSGLSIVNGVGSGGGIFNAGAILTVSDSVIANNQAPTAGSFGAGVLNTLDPFLLVSGSLTLKNSLVSGNVANSSSGAGIYNDVTCTATLDHAQVVANTGTDVSGGGIYNNAATLTVTDSTVSDNVTLLAFNPGLGAGIYNSGTASLTRTLVANNTGPSSGGGVYTTGSGSTFSATNTSIVNNQATNSDGGGLWNNGSAVTLTNVTVAGNRAARGGGLFLTVGSVPPVTLKNTIVATNTASVSGPDVQGTVNTATNNLIGIGTGSTGLVNGVNGNQVGTDTAPINPLLGTLQNNGGPTSTMALIVGSPAIDAGASVTETADQRGFKRKVNNVVDIGAYEFQPPATSTALTSNNNPSTQGQPVTFTATVTPTAPGSNTAAGSVTFYDGNTALATVALANGVAAYTTSALTPGLHAITAAYGGYTLGDYKLDPSTSQTVNQDVRAATTTALTANPNPSNVNDAVTLTATVTGPGPNVPGGTVDFYDGASLLGSAPVTSGIGVLVVPANTFSPNTHPLVAKYQGDVNFAPSDSPVVNEVVGATTTQLTSAPNPANVGDAITLTATVAPLAPGSLTPTGTVTFYDNANALATVPLSGNQAVLVVSTFAPGTHPLTAVYSGDANFTTSTSPGVDEVIGGTVTQLVSAPNPSDVNQQVHLTATVNPLVPGSQTPTGTVTFFDGNTPLGSAPLAGNTAKLGVSFSTPGNHPLTAVYGGDANFATSTSPVDNQGVGATTTTLTSTFNPSNVNQSINLIAQVKPVTGTGTPVGQVTFYDGSTVLGVVDLKAGFANLPVSTFTAGVHTLTAAYAGDGTTFGPSTSPPYTQTVNATATSTKLVVAPPSVSFGQTVTLTATVTPALTGAFKPTGTVSFQDGSTTLAVVTLNNGTAVFSTSSLKSGAHVLKAHYNGDANFTASTSAGVVEVVQPVTYFAVGGAPGRVLFYKPDNTLVADFTPFGAAYTGGVNVAVGDVNGDGSYDLVVGAAVGNPDVRIYSGSALSQNPGNPAAALLVQFFAYGLNFNVGANVAVGDINNDGFADLVTAANVGNPDVRVYNGKDIAQGVFNPNGASRLAQWFPYALQFNVGANVAVGDVNGDGFADVVTGATAGNPHTKVYSGKDIANGTFNPTGSSQLAQWFPYALQFNVGAFVAVGDVNGDGFGDVITGATAGNPDVRVYSGKDIALGTFNPSGSSLLTQFFAYDLNFNVGAAVGAGDFNGDGKAEILTGASAGAPHYRVVAGNATGTKPPALFQGIPGDIVGGIAVAANSVIVPPLA
jgi:hypothetical protein